MGGGLRGIIGGNSLKGFFKGVLLNFYFYQGLRHQMVRYCCGRLFSITDHEQPETKRPFAVHFRTTEHSSAVQQSAASLQAVTAEGLLFPTVSTASPFQSEIKYSLILTPF